MRHAVVIENAESNSSTFAVAKETSRPIQQQQNIHPETPNPIRA